MKFEKRDLVLIVGLIFFMIGLIPFMGAAYAAIIVIIMYFGIQIYVTKRQKSILQDVGEGICMECGSKVIDKKCPICDDLKE